MPERPADHARSFRRRAFLSILLALLLHGALAVWFARNSIDRSPPAQAITIELIEKPPPLIREEQTAPAALQRERVRDTLPVRKIGPVARSGARAEDLASGGQVESGFTPVVEKPGLKTELDQVPPAPSTDPKNVRLFDARALGGSIERWRTPAGMGEEAGPGAGDGASPEAEKQRVEGRLVREVTDIQARGRVMAGLVDPYFRQLKQDTGQFWQLQPSAVGRWNGSNPMSGRGNLAISWLGANRQYARTGNPLPEGQPPAGETPVARPDAKAGDQMRGFQNAADFMARWNVGEFGFAGGVVLLALTQHANGTPISARVVKSSGIREFDLSAIAAVRQAATARNAPAHGLGLGGARIESLWKMEARMVSNTCTLLPDTAGGESAPEGGLKVSKGGGEVSSLGCGGTFDLGEKAPEFDRPLKTKVIIRVELLAVYGGETQPSAPGTP